MSIINKNSESNYGGIAKLFVGPNLTTLDNLSIPLRITDKTVKVLSETLIYENFLPVNFQLESANHDRKSMIDGHGESWQHQVNVRLIKDRAEIRAHISAYQHQKACLLLQTIDGEWKLLFNMVLVSDGRSGKKAMDTNGYFFSWKGTMPVESIHAIVSGLPSAPDDPIIIALNNLISDSVELEYSNSHTYGASTTQEDVIEYNVNGGPWLSALTASGQEGSTTKDWIPSASLGDTIIARVKSINRYGESEWVTSDPLVYDDDYI